MIAKLRQLQSYLLAQMHGPKMALPRFGGQGVNA